MGIKLAMPQQPDAPKTYPEKVLEINKKINNAPNFNAAVRIAAEELAKALDVERIQIILHRPEKEA